MCFKIDGKLFAVAPLEVAPVRLSFKCTAENFAELCERTGIIPAPYMARAQWVALESLNSIPDRELRALLEESYRLVWERLPKKRREVLDGASDIVRPAKPVTGKKPKGVAKPAANASKSVKGRRK